MARKFDELFESVGSPMLDDQFGASGTYTSKAGVATAVSDVRFWDYDQDLIDSEHGRLLVITAHATIEIGSTASGGTGGVEPDHEGTLTYDGDTWSIVAVRQKTGNRRRLVLQRQVLVERTTGNTRTRRL